MSTSRLDDPLEHFPYKRDVVDQLIAQNPPAGPGGPDDDSLNIRDHISPAIAAANHAHVEAQAAHLTDPTPETKAAVRATAEALVAARQRHRANRKGAYINGIRGAE